MTVYQWESAQPLMLTRSHTGSSESLWPRLGATTNAGMVTVTVPVT